MGLFDALQFDPSSYGGQGGGILDLLKQYASQPGANIGQPNPQSPNLTPDSTVPVGNYQMPMFGASLQSAAGQLPMNAQPAQGQMAPGQAAPGIPPQTDNAPLTTPPAFLQPPSQSGFGGAMRGALANAQTGPIGMLLGGIAGGMGMGQGNPQDVARQNLKAQYDALVPVLGPQKAMLAVMNPEAGKTLISEAMTNKADWGVIGEDMLGNKQYGWINKIDQTINGKGADGSGAGANSPNVGYLAPGVKQIDSTLTGDDYLKQFSPEIQAGVKDYIDGKSTPTGNPRKGYTQAVKMIAQKYGSDIGVAADDVNFAARKTMRNQLSSSAPSTLGGQINIGNTAAGHLADLSQKALELGNYDTGIAPLTSAVNSVRGLGTEQAAKMEALKGAAQHYGQEITKFYAGSPGGVAERDRFIESVNGAKSPKELAAILATEGELMRSRLDALGGQIKGVLGDEGLKQFPVLRPDGQAALAKVEENVSKLKGGVGAQSAPSTSAIPPGWKVQVH